MFKLEKYKTKWEMIKNLPRLDDIEVTLGDTIYIKSNSISKEQKSYIDSVALSLLPWEKGHLIYLIPYIGSEWEVI